jgi:hypothetical protein
MFQSYDHLQAKIYFRLKMVIRLKHVGVTEYNIKNSVALDGNSEPDVHELYFVSLGIQLVGRFRIV